MIRSSVVPQTIASETAQNDELEERNFASMVASESDIDREVRAEPGLVGERTEIGEEEPAVVPDEAAQRRR